MVGCTPQNPEVLPAGNLVYAFTLLADRWCVMLIGRAVAGAGSPILVLGSAYISQVSQGQLQ